MKTNRNIIVGSSAAIILASILLPSALRAQPSAHYVPGLEGIKGASLPPPGVYLRDYNIAYFSNQRNDSNGDEISGLDPEAFIYANAPRLIWITEWKVLGGFIGFDALIPFQFTDLQLNTPGGRYSDNTFGIGDLFAEATWSAHPGQFDVAVGYGIWAPTGDSSSEMLTTRAGLGYWTHMFTAGVTYFPDSKRQWAVSVLNRYEINTEKEDTNWTPGDAYTVEGALSYSIKPTIDLGVVAYYQRQVTADDPAGLGKDQVAAVGPEITAFCTKIGVNASLRYLYEVFAEDRLQGHTVALTLTKRF